MHDPTPSLDRRRFLGGSGLLAAGVVAGPGLLALAGCSSDSSPASSPGGSAGEGGAFGTLTYRLSWIKNAQFSSAYIADTNGYFAEAGFGGVDLIAGGPNAAPGESPVAGGQAFVAVSFPDFAAQARGSGADVKVVGAQYQKNPFCIMSLAETPIPTPQAMYGKRIGIQAANETTWEAFLAAAELDASQIEKVPVQFDPQGLISGEVDGWMSFFNDEPQTLAHEGIDVTTFMFADHGYPLVSEVLVVRDDTITDRRDELKAFLHGEVRGWIDSLRDPALGAHLAVTKYGAELGLDEEVQTLCSKAQNTVVLTDETRRNGLLTISPELMAKNVDALAIAGIDIAADELFDMGPLTELYEEHPELVSALADITLT